MSSLQQFFNYCLENNLPVAFYRLPNKKSIKVVGQKNSSLTKISDLNKYAKRKGFLFAPFCENKELKKAWINADIFCSAENLPTLQLVSGGNKLEEETFKATSKKQFFNYVKNIKKEIKKNNFRKIVAARVVKTKTPKDFSAVAFFELLCKKYPAAFVSLVYAGDYGLWVGASPEILLSVKEKKFKTYSLAGTKANSKTNWGEKEKEEQQIVSDYIQKIFSSITKEKPLIDGAKTVAAGNLFHLKTTFTYSKIPHARWTKIATELHPTPAVAGIPKVEAINFIRRNENRSFYSGYLGTVNLDDEVNLFVNIRCAQILKNALAVYVGCGITADSKIKDEWNETKIKSQTLLNVLKK